MNKHFEAILKAEVRRRWKKILQGTLRGDSVPWWMRTDIKVYPRNAGEINFRF